MNNIINDYFIVLCNYNNEFEIINQELLGQCIRLIEINSIAFKIKISNYIK